MKRCTPAVVLAHGPGGLGAVRCLARKGIPVTVIAYGRDEAVIGSRWPARTLVATGSDCQKERQIPGILAGLDLGEAALLATSDRMVELMARHREALSAAGFRFLIPSLDLIQTLNDKVAETQCLAAAGAPVPKTVFPLPPRPSDLERELGPDVIFKPRSYAEGVIINRKNFIARNREEIEAVYRDRRDFLPLMLAQEIIPGDDDAGWVVSGSFGPRSEMLACAMKRKIRMYPPHFGVSSIAVSEWRQEVADLTRDLAARLNHVGHANFEFRYDYRDGLYKYIEMNPRIQGNVEFDDLSGVPTVWYTYRVALGETVEPWPTPQRDGAIYMDALDDVLGRLHDGELPSSILRHYASFRGARRHGAYFSWDDPVPGMKRLKRFLAERAALAVRRFRRPLETVPAAGPAARHAQSRVNGR